MAISDRIKKVRGNLTQKEFAIKIGVSYGAVQNWEIYNQMPNGSALLKIKEIFNVDLNWLIQDEDKIEENNPRENLICKKIGEERSNIGAEEIKISELVSKTIEILQSNTIYRTALTSNINAFHQAIISESKLENMDKRILQMENLMRQLVHENNESKKNISQMQEQISNSGDIVSDSFTAQAANRQ